MLAVRKGIEILDPGVGKTRKAYVWGYTRGELSVGRVNRHIVAPSRKCARLESEARFLPVRLIA